MQRDPIAAPISRRRFLAASGGAAAGLFAPLEKLIDAQPPLNSGRFVRTLPLGDPARLDDPPLNQLLGAGLDARLFTDLSRLDPEATVTPTDQFFIRTACPDEVAATSPWTVALGDGAPRQIPLDTLGHLVTPTGTHLLECAGNTNPNNYGLISVARWDGIPIGALLDRLPLAPGTSRVLVSGIDDERHPSRTSVPSASWIFSRDDLERAHAFLATHMNGAPLAPHHGAPVRLVVPGWYGCACIKWVNRVLLVPDDAEPTPQMREFATRTHQPAGATLARDFTPATIDVAAVPIRVEQWAVGGRPVYRVVGIVWGGSTPTSALQIRFQSGEAWADVTDCPRPATTATWSLWWHRWMPTAPGRYHLVLRVNDPAIRTRRLDLFFYARAVDITEV
ncbi:MAG TPA: molybdopterin-dependent oxidoreductase [Vicinamibacterales bacterium]|nr:molybdopterin-dependent oxidoreductase [Vicinamibacterales bacterium]